jgi:hypothetical protein
MTDHLASGWRAPWRAALAAAQLAGLRGAQAQSARDGKAPITKAEASDQDRVFLADKSQPM